MVIPERFRMILASLVERWFSSVAPGVRKNLFVASRSTTSRGGSAARRAADPHLYSALGDLVGHTEGTLLNSFAVLAWRGLKHDVTRGRSSLYPILFIDVVLSLKVPAAGLARRVATVLDGAVSRGAWDDAAISRLKSILHGEKSPTLACGQFQTSLEHCWMQLKKTDTSNLFALPVTDNVVICGVGYG